MSSAVQQLSGSAFISDLGPGERSAWRFVFTVVLGFVAFVIAAVVGIALSFALLIALAGWPAPISVPAFQALLHRFLELTTSDGRSFGEALQLLAVAIPDNILPIFAVIGVALLIHQRPLRAFITSARRFRWRLLLSGLVFSIIIIGPFLALTQMLDPKAEPPPLVTVSPNAGLCALYAATCIGAFLPAAFGEEMLFRGWLLRETSAVTRNPIVLVVANGVIFAAAHFQFAPDAFLERAIMGAAFAYMTLRLGGIEFSTGAHLANNLLIVLFLEPLTLNQPPSEPLSAGALGQDAYLLAAYIVMTELTVRWPALRRWAGADQAMAPPANAAAAHFS
jgi:membrane protease YdiL (CAAX protease family)